MLKVKSGLATPPLRQCTSEISAAKETEILVFGCSAPSTFSRIASAPCWYDRSSPRSKARSRERPLAARRRAREGSRQSAEPPCPRPATRIAGDSSQIGRARPDAGSFHLKKQSDKFALAVGVCLGENGFQLVARRLLRYFQFLRGDIRRGAARNDAGKTRLRGR